MSTTSTRLPVLSDVERVSTSVMRILGGNPGKFTLQGTNTYLIFPPPSSDFSSTTTDCLLLDTGQGSAFPRWTSSLHQALVLASIRLGTEARITQCVLTHWHHDHVGGINEVLKICAESDSDSGSDVSQNEPGVKFYKFPLHDPERKTRERESQLLLSANDDHPLPPLHDLHDGEILTVGSEPEKLQLKILHTPGHTSDHIAIVIASSPADPTEVGSIFTGDAVLGHGTAVFEDLTLYMSSLKKMKKAVQHVGQRRNGPSTEGKVQAFPAHGAVIHDVEAKIQEYIDHRRRREKEVLNVMSSGSTTVNSASNGVLGGDNGSESQAWTPMQIVKVVYKDVPESLHPAAMGGVVQVLKKLEGEGRVEKVGSVEVDEESVERWRVLSGQPQHHQENGHAAEGRKAAL